MDWIETGYIPQCARAKRARTRTMIHRRGIGLEGGVEWGGSSQVGYIPQSGCTKRARTHPMILRGVTEQAEAVDWIGSSRATSLNVRARSARAHAPLFKGEELNRKGHMMV